LSDVLGNSVKLTDALHIAPGLPELSVLPPGGKRSPLAGEFAGDAFKSTLAELSNSAGVILIDSPPILTEASITALLDSVDAVILVARARVSLKADAAEARMRIEGAGVHFLGAVLNRFRPEFSRSIG
jgi:Mrp family chromosome partitioning ATPase